VQASAESWGEHIRVLARGDAPEQDDLPSGGQPPGEGGDVVLERHAILRIAGTDVCRGELLKESTDRRVRDLQIWRVGVIT
jgi:hypothetical protein